MTKPAILKRARADILAMQPYSSARSLLTPDDRDIMLDANEMPFEPLIGSKGYNRYVPQQPAALINALADFYNVRGEQLLIGRGVDEAIEVLTRLFCTPGGDNIIVCSPAFPMYEMSAKLNGTATKKVPLDKNMDVDVAAVLQAVDADTKIVYLCSPNNPLGNSIAEIVVVKLCEA